MGLQRWLLAVGFYLASVLGTGNSVMTAETQRYTCRTFGSGVVQPFIGQSFYVRSDCPFTLIHFTHNRVECEITIRRDDSGLLVFVEISINKIRTVLQNGSILVEEKSVSLPYDHTYQHIFQYGIYTKLRSSLLPLSVTWNDVPGGKDSLWVELNQELSSDMTGLCGSSKAAGSRQQIISESVLAEDTCQTRDPVSSVSPVCRQFFSFTLDCFQASTLQYIQLCEENIYGFEKSKSISCAFFREMIQQCGNGSFAWNIWRAATECDKPSCPGDLEYVEQGLAFVPSCSNHNLRFSNQDLTSSCVCPEGKVLNDGAAGFRCVSVSSCPCEFAGMSYQPGESRSTKCQSCVCARGEWQCSENVCPTPCLIEGPFVRTFDGKQYAVPGKCTYVASQGQNWKIIVEFSAKAPAVKSVILQIFQETYTFSEYRVTVGEEEITELHQSDNALVFWQSSMYSQVYTSLGVNIQVQMSPEIQLYITPPGNQKDMISGLCGNNNNDTTDDFSTSGGIVENSAQPFALSWSVGGCAVNIPPFCTITDNEIFAEEKCSVLNDPRGVFAECHAHIPTDHYYTACIQRTCKCGSSLQQCLCVALGSYAKACASLGVVVGDWREATDCTVKCQKNQEFFYDILACNRTCRSLSGPDPRCGLDEGPVEGCGCPEGTHLSRGHICTPKAECDCHYYGGTTPPGPADIDGQKCSCENGELHCSKDCGCRNGKVCVHCSEDPVNTAQKSCDSLSKPTGISVTCESGCYCPSDQYEDHHGSCVSLDDCTCVYSGQVFSAGQSVRTNCKTCVCGQGQWHCKDKPCPGRCQVYGNGHFQTFDSKWFRFDGNCMYTLVEDECGNKNSTFSIRVESVPCCDEALTCSRSIILDLQDKVTLVLSDMRVSQSYHVGGIQEDLQYTIYTVGLYIVISVPNKGITLIWDKHTRVTVELSAMWRNKVCGLCGNFDSNEMNDLQKSNSTVMSSPLTFGNSWKVPPCSDVLTEIFPCERHSYCSTWADRRCMIITGDTFKDCHLKVDPEPYFHACVQESCSCEFEGKFLGFCTAVAAYAEACSDVGVCINWRTPDLCPVYCDYYNEQGQCSWHYEACGQMLICGRSSLTHKLEGCYPRCSKAAPYYDENIGKCTELRNCSCYFNDTIIQPGAVVLIQSTACRCQNGTVHCLALPTTTTPPPTTAGPTELPTITPPPTTAGPTELPTTTTLPPTTAGLTELPTITPPPTTAGLTELPTITPPPTTAGPTELPTTTLPPTTAGPTELPTTTLPLTTAGPTELPTTTTLPPTTAGPTELPTITPPSTTAGPTELPTITPPPTTAGPTELPTTTTLPPTTAGPTELPTTTPPPTTAGPTELPTTTPPPTTAGPTELPTTTTLPPTTAGPTELPTTTLPPTTAGPTELPTTTLPPPTTAGPTELPTTTPPPTTAGPTELPTTTPPPTTAGPTELPTTTPPPTTAGPTELPTITPPPTTAGPTELPTTTLPPPTPAGPTELPTITPPPTTAGLTELPTTTLPPTTAGPTELPTITPPPTTAEPTELPTTTTLPPTTAGPTELPTITPPPTTAGLTELPTTTLPPTTAGPTELPTITPPPTTAEPTELPTTTTLPPTTAGLTELPTITPPSTTAGPTELPTTTTLPPTTTGPTELPTTTTLPPTTAGPTELPTTTLPPPTTAGPTELPTTTPPPTTAGPTELPTTIPPSPSTTSATTTSPTTITPCECKDLKRKKSWSCNETWVEDCFSKSCVNRKIELTPVVCPEPVIPSCPRQQVRKVSDGCCETWKCDCRCDLYGDPHYITFQGVTFDFLDDCTYILVEERSPRHHLMIAVDNFYCVPGLEGSCVKGIILKYQTSVATLKIIPPLFSVKATLNNMTIEPPYEEQGWRFEVTGYIVSIYLPEIRSYVSLSPSYNLVINLAMEHFFNNTQGQCGVCGGGSCIRKGGQIEDDSCCGKTAYDWVYDDPQKPACLSAPKDVPCHWGTSRPPPTPCPASSLCELLHHPVFSNCSRFVDLAVKKKSCDFDSCRTGACSSLEQAAEECKKAGFCVDWRRLTHGGCDWKCPAGLVYRECRNKLDDFCYGGVKYPGGSFEPSSAGCFCPSGLKRAGAHSNICVSECRHCKGPLGEPRLPGEVWQSGCHLCTCNNQTRTEECFLKPLEPPPTCGPDAELVNTSCCGDLACLEKTCIYNGKTYKMGDRWKDAAHPCMSFLCNKDGVQTETKVCPTENCQEQDRIWDDQHCCFTCDQSCAPKVTSINITIDNCTTIMQMPVCQGQCVSQPRVVLHGDVQMEHKWRCCQEQSSERRSVTLQCSDLSERRYAYKHITSCECGACGILR
ncbi:mucin-2-like isoform X2 [Cheilinus undulatus]|uniref:mucin-2-like isoform X2 n=1 Tax=Cheilinus undulatus TaxID=241271 RepID=UPI001BD30514|nr:mucin-2-like isoform X2 [Cheilinus undulatus]